MYRGSSLPPSTVLQPVVVMQLMTPEQVLSLQLENTRIENARLRSAYNAAVSELSRASAGHQMLVENNFNLTSQLQDSNASFAQALADLNITQQHHNASQEENFRLRDLLEAKDKAIADLNKQLEKEIAARTKSDAKLKKELASRVPGQAQLLIEDKDEIFNPHSERGASLKGSLVVGSQRKQQSPSRTVKVSASLALCGRLAPLVLE